MAPFSAPPPGRAGWLACPSGHPGQLNSELPLLDFADQWHGCSSSFFFFFFLLVVVFSCHADVRSSQRKKLLYMLCSSTATTGQMTSWAHHKLFLGCWCSAGFLGHHLSSGTSPTALCFPAGLQVPFNPEGSFYLIHPQGPLFWWPNQEELTKLIWK